MKNSDAGATFFFITSSPAFLKTFDFNPLFSTFGANYWGPNRLQVYKCECTSGLIECSFLEQSDDAACAADEVYGSRR